MNATVTSHGTIGGALADRGWHPDSGATRWRRQTPVGPATLIRRRGSAGWEEWDLWGGAVPNSGPLAANAAVAGPGKLVRGADGGCHWRSELPREAIGRHDETDPEVRELVGAWARDISAVADGEPVGEAPFDPGVVAAELEKSGWPAVAADGVVRVSVPLPGLFRQMTLDGARLRCELADLDGVEDECREAALYLAAVANDRLRLARFALLPDAPAGRLVAEVHLGSLGVSGAWLGGALESLHAAVALTAREFAALRGDRELAVLVLAARAAGKGGVACPQQ